MKLLTSTLLIGASFAAAYVPEQVPMQDNGQLKTQAQSSIQDIFPDVKKLMNDAAKVSSDEWKKIMDSRPKTGKLADDIRHAWKMVGKNIDDIADIQAEMGPFVKPKLPVNKKPDSHWDHIVRGSDLQSSWVLNAQGTKEREIDGKLDNYNMRIKKVDPSKLGVDTVKQYSGYLDDDENDKHLFYCMY
jgi:cathepsin A (carboxypeptidase C)